MFNVLGCLTQHGPCKSDMIFLNATIRRVFKYYQLGRTAADHADGQLASDVLDPRGQPRRRLVMPRMIRADGAKVVCPDVHVLCIAETGEGAFPAAKRWSGN